MSCSFIFLFTENTNKEGRGGEKLRKQTEERKDVT